MIVRELLTLLGFTVDKASYDKAAKSYDTLQGKLVQQQKGAQGAATATKQLAQANQQAAQGTNLLGQALGMAQRFAASAGLSSMVKDMVEMASNANETSNVLDSVFGAAGQKQVEEWAERQAAAMGRSKYSLQSYASQLGAVLGPVTSTKERAQEMSKTFSELAVDLGSFFNTTDEDAMRALRSGLTGEYESLKRYGVVLNDATLAEIASQRGIKKKITQMTVAEKTELRYAAILERTKAAQGDAAKTGDGFANASKAVGEALKDLKTDIGKTVLPVVNKFIRGLRDMLNWFNKTAKGTHVLEAAMYTLAGVAAILAAEFYGAFIVPALAIGALILLIDELWTTFEGGDTYIRDFIDSFAGAGATAEIVENLKAGIEAIRQALQGLDARGIWDTFAAGVDNAGFAIQRLIEKLIDLAGWLNPIEAATRLLRKAGVLGQGEAEGRAMGRGINAPVAESISQELALRQADQARAIRAGVAARAERQREAQYGPRVWSMLPEETAAGYGVLRAPMPAAAGGGGGGAPVVNNAAPVIIINGGDEAKIKKVVTETVEAERKKTAAALGGRGRS